MYPYFLEHEDGIYRYIFVTKFGVKYAVYFAIAEEYFGLTDLPHLLRKYGYTFGIVRMTHEEKCIPLDPTLKHTVAAILKDFYLFQPNAVLMINYDDHDEKQHKRVQHFQRWFDELNRKSISLIKEDTEIIAAEKTTFVSMILSVNYPFHEDIYDAFFQVKQNLTNGK